MSGSAIAMAFTPSGEQLLSAGSESIVGNVYSCDLVASGGGGGAIAVVIAVVIINVLAVLFFALALHL